MKTQDKRAALIHAGFVIGVRNPRINTDYEGRFMVVEQHEETELPTQNGANGPWAIVGDNLESLIEEAYENATPFDKARGEG